MLPRLLLAALLLLPPSTGRAGDEPAGAARPAALQSALSLALVQPPVTAEPAAEDDERARFERTMAEITRDVPGLVVTSKHRSEADQQRLRERGYRPHPHSQHRLGLAWDCAAPEESLAIVQERARSHGFTALRMRSPVTGHLYLHVQRFARSPLADGALAAAAAVPEPPAGLPEPLGIPGVEQAVEVEPAPAVPEPAAVAAAPVIDAPKPIGVTGFEFPRRLLRKKVQGEIVLLVDLEPDGTVRDLQVDVSTLPAFEDFVAGEVRRWRFTPPTVQGRPVAARARLPIPIRIQ